MPNASTLIPALALAIETTTSAGSVVLIENPDAIGERVLFKSEWQRDRSHSELLGPALEAIQSEFSRLSFVAIGVGPGSFTGIRVGVNSGRAIGWSLGKPVVPVSSTENILDEAALAVESGTKRMGLVTLAALPAQMGMVFVQWKGVDVFAAYPEDVVKRLKSEISSSATEVLVVGESADELHPLLLSAGFRLRTAPRPLAFPTAITAARVAARKIRSIDPSALVLNFNWLKAQPLYLRGSGAEEKRA